MVPLWTYGPQPVAILGCSLAHAVPYRGSRTEPQHRSLFTSDCADPTSIVLALSRTHPHIPVTPCLWPPLGTFDNRRGIFVTGRASLTAEYMALSGRSNHLVPLVRDCFLTPMPPFSLAERGSGCIAWRRFPLADTLQSGCLIDHLRVQGLRGSHAQNGLTMRHQPP